nr:choice-of-anchor D domain-containing protein [uncultured Albidiferax sp.]
MGKYSDANLIRYEEAIQLHFDSTGKTAWLTLKNYGWVFGVRPFDAIKQVTVGVSVDHVRLDHDAAALAFIEVVGFTPDTFRPYQSGPISISAMLDAIDVIRFQVEALKANERADYRFRLHDAKGYLLWELNQTIVGIFRWFNPDFVGSIDVRADDKRFWAKTSARLFKLLHQSPGALAIQTAIGLYNSERTGLTAYLPLPGLILEEQRTALKEGGAGTTVKQDMRAIDPLPAPSNVPIEPKFLDDGIERSSSGPFIYDEFIRMLDADYVKRRYFNLRGDNDDFLWRKTAPITADYLHRHIQRICCYTFRGDTRDPASVEAAGGLLPGFTRRDKGVAAFKEIGEEIDKAVKEGHDKYISVLKKHQILHLGVYTLLKDFRGYISTTTSIAMAKCFANDGVTEVHGNTYSYCYAVRCHGGFHLPSSVPDKRAKFDKKVDSQHTFAHFAEQEVAMPGAIPWNNDVVGVRVIRCDGTGQYFSGPVFLKDMLKREDMGAFSEIFELLSGKSQGEGFMIETSYDLANPPFAVRSPNQPVKCDAVSSAFRARLSPGSFDFSYQIVGTAGAHMKFTITNNRQDALQLWDPVISGEHANDFKFALDARVRPPPLKAGESHAMTIQFAPTAVGKRRAEFKWNGQVATLTGTGCLQELEFTPTSLHFERQALNSSGDLLQLTLTNRGIRKIPMSSLGIYGSHKTDFTIQNEEGWIRNPLKVGESRIFDIQFLPTESGDRTAIFEVRGQTVVLTGTGL